MELSIGRSVGVDLLRYRQLLLSLTWRDIRIRYKQSLLGVAWALLLPLAMMLIFTFVFTKAIDTSSILKLDMPYAMFAYLGLVPWTFFSQSLSGCTNSLVSNRNLVTKVYFPREVFPLSSIGSCFADFLIAMTVLVGLIAYFHLTGQWTFTASSSLLFLPVVVAVQIILTIGIGMMLAMANLFYRDIRQLFAATIQLLMFVSNVVVPIPRDGSTLSTILSINPMVPIIDAYRSCVIRGEFPEFAGFAYATAVSLALLIVGWIIFRRASYRFAECI